MDDQVSILQNDQEFAELVLRDVRGQASPEEHEILVSQLDRWINELKFLLKDLEIQFTSQRAKLASRKASMIDDPSPTTVAAWYRYKSDADFWKVKTNRFRVSIERRLAHAKSLRKHHGRT